MASAMGVRGFEASRPERAQQACERGRGVMGHVRGFPPSLQDGFLFGLLFPWLKPWAGLPVPFRDDEEGAQRWELGGGEFDRPLQDL